MTNGWAAARFSARPKVSPLVRAQPVKVAADVRQLEERENVVKQVKQPQMKLKSDGRIDHHLHKGNTLFGRYSYNNVNTTVPGWFPTVKVAGLSVQPQRESVWFSG